MSTRTLLGTNAAAFAVVIINLIATGFFDHRGIRTKVPTIIAIKTNTAPEMAFFERSLLGISTDKTLPERKQSKNVIIILNLIIFLVPTKSANEVVEKPVK